MFDEIGYYNENYRIASDWEFFLKALVIFEKSYQHISMDISYFRIGGVSSSRENFDLAYSGIAGNPERSLSEAGR